MLIWEAIRAFFYFCHLIFKCLYGIIGDENVDAIAKHYADAYEGTNLTDKEVWEECICDSLGDMNIFAGDEIDSKFMAPAMTEVKSATENTAKSPTQTRGSPEGKASRETKKKNGKLAKYLPESKVGKANMEFVRHQLMDIYYGVSDGIADGVAIEQGQKVPKPGVGSSSLSTRAKNYL